MRARYPDRDGFVVRDGIKVAFEVYENDNPTILLMPTWSIVHSRHWKAQIPYLARHFRVVTFDGRGNGRSDRPTHSAAYADTEFVEDALAVLDATATDRAVVAGISLGAHWTMLLAGLHPDRVTGTILVGPSPLLVEMPHPDRQPGPFEQEPDADEGWAQYNMHFWRRDYRAFCEFFFSEVFSEPHSTKQQEDAVGWSQETDAETLIAIELADTIDKGLGELALASIRSPVLIIHGTEDRISPIAAGVAFAQITGGTLLSIEGGGHLPQARDPIRVNLAIKEFVDHVGSRRGVLA